MTDYKVLFLDIDGTIMRPDDTIEDSTKLAIQKVQEKGLQVFLATGRPLHEIAFIAEELKIQSFIGYNGAFAIYDGKTIIDEPMDANVIEEFLKIAKEHHHEAVLYTSEKNVYTQMDSPIIKVFIEKFHLHKNDLYTPEVINSILGVTLINLGENDTHLYEKKGEIHLSQVNVEGLTNNYDVIRDNVNKGIAVEKILKILNIPAENAIAFGDGMNDKEMLSLVGEGFAMGNAHPDLFAYANNKTTEVTNSGIYNGLKSLGLI